MDMMTARRVSSNGMTPRLTSSGPLKILWGSAAHKRKYGSCPLLPRIFLDISVCHVCPSASGFGFIKNLFDPCGKLLWIIRIDQDGILAVNKIGLKARNARRHDGHAGNHVLKELQGCRIAERTLLLSRVGEHENGR